MVVGHDWDCHAHRLHPDGRSCRIPWVFDFSQSELRIYPVIPSASLRNRRCLNHLSNVGVQRHGHIGLARRRTYQGETAITLFTREFLVQPSVTN